MRITATAADVLALELLAVEIQLAGAVSIVTPKMPPATERPVAGGLLGFVEAVKGWRPELAPHSLAGLCPVSGPAPLLCEDVSGSGRRSRSRPSSPVGAAAPG